MQIYFVRHGQTQYNLEQRFQGGRVDSPLLTSGIRGAQQAGAYLADVHFARVYSSPQKRALDTAAYITAANRWHPQIKLAPNLREMDFGDWDGQLEKDVQPQAQLDIVVHHPDQYRPELAGGGESYPQFVARITQAVHAAVAEVGVDSTRPLLIVSHGLVTTMSIKALLGVSIADIRKPLVINGRELPTVGYGIVDNDSLTVVETLDNRHFEIKTWNETGYLKPAES